MLSGARTSARDGRVSAITGGGVTTVGCVDDAAELLSPSDSFMGSSTMGSKVDSLRIRTPAWTCGSLNIRSWATARARSAQALQTTPGLGRKSPGEPRPRVKMGSAVSASGPWQVEQSLIWGGAVRGPRESKRGECAATMCSVGIDDDDVQEGSVVGGGGLLCAR